jgi:hypothetical protein
MLILNYWLVPGWAKTTARRLMAVVVAGDETA